MFSSTLQRGASSLVVKAALDAAPVTDYVQSNVAVADVKKFLDKGFVLVDIRAPDELQETGYKSSWKHIAVRARMSTLNSIFLPAVLSKSVKMRAHSPSTDHSTLSAVARCVSHDVRGRQQRCYPW